MKKVLYVVCFFAFSIIGNAQEKTMSLSLDEAVSFGIKNSFNSKIADNNIRKARKVKWETTTIGLPQIDAKVDYINNIKQQFPGVDFNQDGVIDFGAKHSVTATGTIRQLIFDGSYLIGLQSAKTYLKISKQAKEKTELSTREAVINAYGNVLVAEKTIEILLKNKTINDKILHDTRVGFENGLIEEEDVEQFEIIDGNLISNIRTSQRMKKIALKLLNLSLGNPIETELNLTDTLDSLVVQNTVLGLISETFDIENHIDFKIAENDRETKRLLMQFEKSKALPSLSAFANYSYIGNSDSFPLFDGNQTWIPTSVFGVSLKVPIFSSLKRSAKTAQARIELESSDLQLEEAKKRLNLAVQNAKSVYQLSIDTYYTATKNLDLATRIEKKQQIKFNEGLSSSFELLQAQNQLYTQQNSYVQAMLNIISKKASLDNALNIPLKK